MTLYARSDLAYVNVPTTSGGCGSPHRRPVEDGAPAKLWPLNCAGLCEEHLRHDPHWSTTIAEIPETYDESKAREDFDKRGAKDRDQVLALALAKLAGVELPESLIRPITGNLPHAAVAKMVCPSGHENLPGMKFCGECGSPMHGAAPNREIAPSAAPQGAQEPAKPAAKANRSAGSDGGSVDLLSLHPRTLAAMCRKEGLDDSGSVAEMAARISEHREKVAA